MSSLIPKTPEILPAVRIRHETPFGHMHVSITVDIKEDTEREIFAHLGKAGDIASADLEAMCRLASVILRMSAPLSVIIDQLHGIGSSLAVSGKETKSLAHSLAEALEKYREAVKAAGGRSKLLLGEYEETADDNQGVS